MIASRRRSAGPLLLLFPLLALTAACGAEAPPDEGLVSDIGVEPDEPILVFAAASLADALEEAGAAWGREWPEERIDFSFAGSNDLARQIAAGAPADLFLAADRARLEAAAVSGRIDTERAIPLLGNALVVVVPADGEGEVSSARDLLAFDRLGLADPEAVPAGVYARAWLEAEGVWDALRDRVVPALDVRANLAAVASGSVDAGVVYATDAAAAAEGAEATGGLADRVRVVHRVDPGAHEGVPRVVYRAALVGDPETDALTGRSRGRALRFLEFLATPEAGEIFRRHGFEHLPADRDADLSDG